VKEIIVSIIIPIRNEEKYIIECVKSLTKQDYSKDKYEIIFVDGCSNDNTLIILKEYIYKNGVNNIKILKNEHRTVPYAMNAGIKIAAGKYIIRMDAHSEYAINYISKCVFYLETVDAENVGGIAKTVGKSYVGKAIALMLSSKFGVGNSKFRTSNFSGYVDTVPFGAFRKELFERIGYYNEKLTRNQDNEFNYRIRKNGGKIYLTSDIQFKYYCRDTVFEIVKMAFLNGKWNVITENLCPGTMSYRHFAPMLFALSVMICFLFFILDYKIVYLLYLEFLCYFFLDLFFSVKETLKLNLRYFPLLVFLFPLFHLSYGMGSIYGLFSMFKLKF